MQSRKDRFRYIFALSTLSALTLGSALTAHAGQESIPGSRFTSGRGAALGGATLPLGDDPASGLFYNPATLGKIRGTQLEPLNLTLTGNADYLMGAGFDMYKVTSLKSYEPVLRENPGSYRGVSGSLFPNFGGRGWGVGILMQTDFAGVSRNGQITYRSKYQFIPTAGGAVRLFGGIVRLGYTLQYVNQANGEVTVPEGSDPMGWNQQLSEGAAMSHNLGAAITLPFTFLPSLNFVARNVGGARFTGQSLLHLGRNMPGKPETEPMTLDASFSIQPKFGAGVFYTLVAEARDLRNVSQTDSRSRLGLGLEVSFRDSVLLRGGLGSGYPTAGVGLRSKTREIHLAWYSLETGDHYRSERDMRYLLQYQVRVF